MKFTNGYWEIRPGCTPHYAVQVHEVEMDGESLTIYAPTIKLAGRGDTLNQPVLTVRFSAPLENVIRVQVWHHTGGQASHPNFALLPHDASPTIEDNPEYAALRSGQLSVRISKTGDWLVEYLDAGSRRLTASLGRSLGFVDTPDGRFIHEQLSLGGGECVYGLGERFTAFVKNGQVVDLWNEDGGTSSEQAYKNIPFYLTTRGYGVFVNHPEKVSFEVASEKVERVQFSVPGEALEYFVIYGPTPKEILERYTRLTGRPALPPAWSFGLWLSTSFTTDYDEKTITGMIDGMSQRGIPLHVFHFDCFWMKEFHWCDFTWDERCFPDPAGMLQRLKARGLHVCVWINPYIAQRSALFDEAAAGGYLLKRPNEDVWQWDKWQAGMGIVDFTNPAARSWFQSKLRPLLEMGVDAFKTDFGERIPTDAVYFDGSDPQRMHNYYTYLYNQTVFNLVKEVRGEGEALVFARSATAGSQQFPVHWGGDSTATFESMAESLRGGLSLGLSGFGFWSHDIGGFEQTAAAEVYKRWCAFGLLSSHSRLHGSSSYRVPWAYDDEAVAVLAKFSKLKCSLMPYLFGAACQAHASGTPMLRAMLLEFPDDPACAYLDLQYMLGDSLLVAPVFASDNTVNYYVPAGRWTNILNNNIIEGPRWVRETHDFFSLPLLARPNAIIPTGANDQRPYYDYTRGVTFHVFELADGARLTSCVPALDGSTAMTLTIQRTRQEISIETDQSPDGWSVLLHGVGELSSAQGCTYINEEGGVRLIPNENSVRLGCRLIVT
jgi:alpha-D-xyloside xylohydrolase